MPRNSRCGGADDGRAAKREGGHLSALSEVDPIVVGQRPLDYSTGPVAALPRHTIAHTRPSTTHQHAPRPDQPSETSPLTTFLAPFRADRVTSATTFRGLASASAEALRAELELIFVSLLARVERGACARSRVRQSERGAMDALVQRLYACVVPYVAWEERGLSPLVCERDPHGSRIVLLLFSRMLYDMC